MKRVVITGMGVVAPGGVGVKSFWELLTAGRTATRDITLFDAAPFRSRIAAEADFDPAEHGFGPAEAERLDRAAQFALVAAREALADSGVDETPDPLRTGVSLGSAVGCTTGLDTEYAVVSDHGRDWTVDHTRAVAH
ncbi:beta-ACP synthase, partial [Streptomyces sp. TRM76130]|nr:beta-ACP synthase [Streptomyces sp. TRM76130]